MDGNEVEKRRNDNNCGMDIHISSFPSIGWCSVIDLKLLEQADKATE